MNWNSTIWSLMRKPPKSNASGNPKLGENHGPWAMRWKQAGNKLHHQLPSDGLPRGVRKLWQSERCSVGEGLTTRYHWIPHHCQPFKIQKSCSQTSDRWQYGFFSEDRHAQWGNHDSLNAKIISADFSASARPQVNVQIVTHLDSSYSNQPTIPIVFECFFSILFFSTTLLYPPKTKTIFSNSLGDKPFKPTPETRVSTHQECPYLAPELFLGHDLFDVLEESWGILTPVPPLRSWQDHHFTPPISHLPNAWWNSYCSVKNIKLAGKTLPCSSSFVWQWIRPFLSGNVLYSNVSVNMFNMLIQDVYRPVPSGDVAMQCNRHKCSIEQSICPPVLFAILK